MTRSNLRSWLPLVGAGGTAALFLLTLLFLWMSSGPPPEETRFVVPSRADIVLKTVATGAIVPRAEIEIKSRVSGVVHELHVEPGDQVQQGDLIAEIKVIPDSATLNQAQAQLRTAKIEYDNAEVEMQRAASLSERAALSAVDLQRARTTRDLAKQSYDAAWTHLQIVKDGATRGSGDVSTEVRATVGGMVLDVPVEEGESVTETNTFNAGTTIAWVADMTDMIFAGHLDESEVGRIKEGMPLDVTVGALRDQKLSGTLEYISPKGVVVEGSVQFVIRAAVHAEPGLFIRAGSSANADIVLDRREDVLAVDEAALRFEGDRVYVEVEITPGRYERRELEVGLSDGLKIEVLSGLSGDERLKAGSTSGRRG
jgi:HlyD family secretion protein